MLSALWASLQPNATAIRSAQADLTWAQLNARINQLARALRTRGLVGGDAIALICSNRPEFVETFYASQRTGLRLTPVNWHLTADEINYILRDCGARAVVVDGRFVETVAQALEGVDARALLVVDGSHDGFENYDQALSAESPENIEDPVLGSTMGYTSGTTGRPKGVHRPSGTPAVTTHYVTEYVAGKDVNLVTGPLYHAAPLAFSLSLPMTKGEIGRAHV